MLKSAIKSSLYQSAVCTTFVNKIKLQAVFPSLFNEHQVHMELAENFIINYFARLKMYYYIGFFNETIEQAKQKKRRDRKAVKVMSK